MEEKWNVVKIMPESLSTCVCAEEVYVAAGLGDDMLYGKIKTYKQLRINEKTYYDILDIMYENIKKNKKTKKMNKDYARACVSFDWAMYSPISDAIVPEWEIWWTEETDNDI